MSDIIIDGDNSNFIIESGSSNIPVFKVSGSQTLISGSLIPAEGSTEAFSELGSEAKPWKELYVESASINFVKTDESIGSSDRIVKFQRADVEDIIAGRPPRGVKPLSRFQQTFATEGRIGAANRWYTKGRMSAANMSTQLATSDPHNTAIANMVAFKARQFTAVQNMQLNRATCTLLNDRNGDDIIVTMFKGTLANDSNSNITITRIGNTFAPSMTYRSNYILSQNLEVALSAGDFIMFTCHTTSFTSTSYPSITITLDGQYT